MTFPDPLDLIWEFAFGAEPDSNPLEWTWTDASPHVKSSGFQPNRGRPDESNQIPPSTVSLSLENDHGNYTPSNASGSFYPHVKLGTPVRARVDLGPELPSQFELVRDTFTRTLDGIWGRPDRGHLWEATTASPAPLEVDGGRGIVRLSSPVTTGAVQTVGFVDGDILVRITPGQVSTGEPLSAAVYYRWLTFYGLHVFFNLDQSVDLALLDNFGAGVVAFESAVSTYAADAALWLRIEVDGANHRARVWADGDPEPAGWQIDAVSVGLEDTFAGQPGGWQPGWVALLGQRGSGNTNVDPFIAFDELTVMANQPPVFYGQVSEWTPEWPEGDLSTPTSPGYARVNVVASGQFRRLGKGVQEARSALTRSVPFAARAVAYWPMEEDSGRVFGSGLPDGTPIFRGGPAELASVSEWAGSAPLGRFLPGSFFQGAVPTHEASVWRVDWLYRIDAAPGTADRVALSIHPTDSPVVHFRVYFSSTHLRVQAFDDDDVQLYDNGVAIAEDEYANVPLRFTFRIDQDGSDIRYTLRMFDSSTDESIRAFTDPITTGSIGTVGRVRIGVLGRGPVTERAWGHITVSNADIDPFPNRADAGYPGEAAGARLTRLTLEEGVSLILGGSDFSTEPMGPQPVGDILTLLFECAAVGGMLFESREQLALVFRGWRTMYDQTPRLELDAGTDPRQLAPPFRPIEDDQQAANDVTVSRPGGSEARVTDDADIAKRGRYHGPKPSLNAASDDQLQQLAGWQLALGTHPGMRYPSVTPALNQVPDLIPGWLAVNLGDRVTVTNLPPQHPTDTVDLLIQGQSETLTPTSWDGTANTSPAGPWSVGLIHGTGDGTDQVGRRYDTSGSELADALDDVATVFTVTTTAAQSWITTAEHSSMFPFNIVVGGERMTVTGIVDDPTQPAFVRDTTSIAVAFAGSYDVPAPAVAPGDIVLALQGAIQGASSGEPPLSRLPSPSGGEPWQLLNRAWPFLPFKLWWKVAGVDEPDSYTFTQNLINNTHGFTIVGSVANVKAVTPVHANTVDTTATAPAGTVTPSTQPLTSSDLEIRFPCTESNTDSWQAHPDFTLEIQEATASFGATSALYWRQLTSDAPTGVQVFDTSPNTALRAGFTVNLTPRPIQTFTVIRSVNGVTKPHDQGAGMRLAEPLKAAL